MGNLLAPCQSQVRKSSDKLVESESSNASSDSEATVDQATILKVQKTGRRERVWGGGGGEEELSYEEKRDTTKTKAEIRFLERCCNSQMLFNGLDDAQRRAVISQMYKIEVPEGTDIIEQGDEEAHLFYVILDGSFDIFVNNTKVAHFVKGDSFGELALMYDAPRAATVKAAEDSQLFAVHRLAFRTALRHVMKQQISRNQRFLKSIKEFEHFSDEEIRLIDMALVRLTFQKGEVIIRQNEKHGMRFYMIVSGACEWTKTSKTGELESGDLTLGACFGERALITNEKRAATVIAKTSVTTLTLSREDFTELLGSGDIFQDKLNSYNGVTKPVKVKRISSSSSSHLDICDLEVLQENTVGVLGQGAFGVVTLVADPNTETSYALKAIKKCQIVALNQQKHIVNEMLIMRKLAENYNPFLVNLITTFKDELRVYFLLDVCLGGELFTILRRRRKFSEKTARFYTACVTEAFSFMHNQHIIYRDLKPENLVLNTLGYLKITDFGFAKEVKHKTFTLCGTPDYLAPEIVTGQGHNKAVDWWTLGVLLYEMVASIPPFYDDTPINTYKRIIKGKPKWCKHFSPEIRMLIQAFLRVRPVKRIGMQRNGVQLIRRHQFFNGFDWEMLRRGEMNAPIKNKVRDIKDMSNFEKVKVADDEATPVSYEDDFDEQF